MGIFKPLCINIIYIFSLIFLDFYIESMDKLSQQSPWWGPGLAVFAEVTGWIALPVVGALYLGRFLDEKYNTDPWFFLGLTAFSFIITSYGIVKLATRFIREAELEVRKKKEIENNLSVNSKKDDRHNT